MELNLICHESHRPSPLPPPLPPCVKSTLIVVNREKKKVSRIFALNKEHTWRDFKALLTHVVCSWGNCKYLFLHKQSLVKPDCVLHLLVLFLFRYATSGDFCCSTFWSWSWWSISASISERARLPNTRYWQGNKNIDCGDGCFYLPAGKYRLRSFFISTLSLPVWGMVILCANQFQSNLVPRVLRTRLVLCVLEQRFIKWAP